jgi:hypothetical protein
MKMTRIFKMALLVLTLISGSYRVSGQEKSEDFIAILKTSGPYNKQQNKTYPAFTYQPAGNPHLAALRKKYKLDSVAGSGDDLAQAVRLLNFMHNAVPHADVINPPVLTADYIITAYKTNKQAEGCYPLAISLNEIFLSMGFKSRVCILFSEGFAKRDGGHVITVVFLPSLKKWVWMDAENNAYVMDDKGKPLGIAEVRQRLIDGLPLKLNQDANYHQVPVTKEHYLYHFMAEHIYRCICPLNSEYDSQTRVTGKTMSYVELLPLRSYDPPVDNFETHLSPEGYQVITYHTNNDLLFWQLP